MAFSRGNDAKETLGIGKYSPIYKELREKIEDLLHNFPKFSTKNIVDKGGGNVNRLFIIFSPDASNDFSYESLYNIKEDIKGRKWRIEDILSASKCKLTSINFYTSQKYFQKWELGEGSLITEIIYSVKK